MIISFKNFMIEMADTSRALSTETKVGKHLEKHGMVDPESKTAGFSSKATDVPLRHPGTKKPIGVEVKDSAKGAKLVSFALRWIKHEDGKTGRWDISDEIRKQKPKAAAEFDKATITHADGSQSNLKDHINKTYGEPEVGKHLSTIRSDHTDMTPVNANYEDKGVDILHIQGKGSYRVGSSKKRDKHGTGLPPVNGTGQWVISTERKRTLYNQKMGTGMQINFRPNHKSIKNSHTDISTDEGAIALKKNMLRKKPSSKDKGLK